MLRRNAIIALITLPFISKVVQAKGEFLIDKKDLEKLELESHEDFLKACKLGKVINRRFRITKTVKFENWYVKNCFFEIDDFKGCAFHLDGFNYPNGYFSYNFVKIRNLLETGCYKY